MICYHSENDLEVATLYDEYGEPTGEGAFCRICGELVEAIQ